MKNILAFAGSNSTTSINRQLANHVAYRIPGADVMELDLNDFEMPLYSPDREDASGVPELAKDFITKIEEADGLVLSLAEHNGSYSAAFKNLYDWASRHKQEVWSGKPMILMATSPGGRGGQSVLAAAEAKFPRMGANVIATISLPSFHETFSAENGISSPEVEAKVAAAIHGMETALEK